MITFAAATLAGCERRAEVAEESLRRPGPSVGDGQAVGSSASQRIWTSTAGAPCSVYIHRRGSARLHSLSLEGSSGYSQDEGAIVSQVAAAGETLALARVPSHAGGNAELSVELNGRQHSARTPFSGVSRILVSEHQEDASDDGVPAAHRHSWVASVASNASPDGKSRAMWFLCRGDGCTDASENGLDGVTNVLKGDEGIWIITDENARYLGDAEEPILSDTFASPLSDVLVATARGLVARTDDTEGLVLLEPGATTLVQRPLLAGNARNAAPPRDTASVSIPSDCSLEITWEACGADDDAGRAHGGVASFDAAQSKVLAALSTGCILLLDLERWTYRSLGRPSLGSAPLTAKVAPDGRTMAVFSPQRQEFVAYALQPEPRDGGTAPEADGSGEGAEELTAFRVCLERAPKRLYLGRRGTPIIVGHDETGTAADIARLPVGSSYSVVDLDRETSRGPNNGTSRHVLVDVGFSPPSAPTQAVALALFDPLRGRHVLQRIVDGEPSPPVSLSYPPVAVLSDPSCGSFGVLQDQPDGLLTTFSWTLGTRRECASFDLQSRVATTLPAEGAPNGRPGRDDTSCRSVQ